MDQCFFICSNTIVCTGVGCTRLPLAVFISSDISLADALAFISYACRFLDSFLSSYKLSIVFEPFSFSFDLNEYCLQSIVDSSLTSCFSNAPFGLVLIFVDFFSSLLSECFPVYLHILFVNLATVVFPLGVIFFGAHFAYVRVSQLSFPCSFPQIPPFCLPLGRSVSFY